ncbi:MAG: hypothetical protein V2J20_06590 [Wenzhouxiangella sp.]|jgi:hypothetical protein|nr:hypothetical protein [Wenzhouxiangella sp.]
MFTTSLLFLSAVVQASDNQELWDVYPSSIIFAQFNDSNQLIATDTILWSRYESAEAALNGQTFLFELNDAGVQASWTPVDGDPIVIDVTNEWKWSVVLDRSFLVSECLFTFEQSLGARLLANSEGHQVAQRERLTWSGVNGACPDQVSEYVQSTLSTPVMPAHLSDWQSLGSPDAPTETGRFEMQLLHDIRRTRRLLPFEVSAEAGADPLTASLGAVQNAQLRFDLIFNRLSSVIFRDSFQSTP